MKIEAKELGRKIGQEWIWQDLNFTLQEGDCLGVVGPSGSGKTLLLRALSWLDPWDHGEILIDSVPLVTLTPARYRSKVIFLYQKPSFFKASVEEDLKEPYRWKEHSQRVFDRKRILSWLEGFGKGASFLTQETRKLSGGEGQLVAFLRALQLDPQILLLDEPSASMDPKTQKGLETLLKTWLAQEGKSAIFVGHDESQVERLTHRTLLLKERKERSS